MNARITKKAHSDVLASVRDAMPPDMVARLRAVADLSEDQIDTDDLPEALNWRDGIRGKFAAPVTGHRKQQVSTREPATASGTASSGTGVLPDRKLLAT